MRTHLLVHVLRRRDLPRPALRHTLLLGVFVLGVVACTADPSGETLGSGTQPIIDPENPVLTAPSTADLAPLNVWGSFPQTGPTGAPAASGQYTAMTDLDQDPTPITSTGTNLVDASSWLGRASSYASAPNFSSYLGQATSAAINATQPMTGELQPVWDSAGLGLIFGEPDVTAVGQSFYGFTPVAGRYVKSQYGTNVCTSRFCLSGATNYSYPDPPDLQEQRERGARLYCAARAAQQAQGSSTIVMGEEAAVSFNLLGQNIQLLAVEPMVSIDGPQKYVGTTTDGAQAFMVPMKFGTRITPVKGFGLPSLPEVRYPVALVSADSEVATDAQQESVREGLRFATVYGKRYLTVEHMDGFAGGAAQAQSSNTFLLFTVGPIDFDLTLGLKLSAGESQIAPGRVLSSPLCWTDGSVSARSTVMSTSSFWDGPWHNTDCDGAFYAETQSGGACCGTNWSYLGGVWPDTYYTKAMQNDDHYLQGGATSLALNATLTVAGGLDFGPVNVSLDLSGGITGTVNQLHMVRDAAFAQQPHGTSGFVPAEGVVVRPRTTANVTAGPLSASLNMSVNCGFFTASWTVPLFSTGTIPLASYDSDSTNAWPASSQLRIGTGSDSGADIRDQPTVDTQLPNGSPFQALPESVSACLADTTPNPPNAPVCGSTPASGPGAPAASLCAVENLNEFQCSTVGTLTTLPTPTSYQQCGNDLNMYLCGITPQWQPAGNSVSSVVDSAQLTAIGNELQQCGTLAAKAGLSQSAVQSYLQNLVGFTACTSTGQPITNPFQGVSPGTAPGVTSGNACN